MSSSQLQASYARACLQDIVVRRYVGVDPDRSSTDYPAKGNARLYGANELVAGIIQGDQQVIVLATALVAVNFVFPLTTDDKVVVDGVELAVVVPGTRKDIDGTLIAYQLQARG